MTFPTNFARALVPVGGDRRGSPHAAPPNRPTWPGSRRHLAGADDDREFHPDRCAGTIGGRNAADQAAGQGPLRIWRRRPAARRQRQDADLRRLSGRAEIELAARPHAARRAAVGFARLQRARREILPSNDSRVVVVRAREHRRNMDQLTLAFLRNGSAPGGLQLYGWTAIDRRTTAPRSSCRTSATTSPSRKAPSPTPNRRRKSDEKSFVLRLVHRSVRRACLNRRSILQLLGVSPCYPGCGIPCVTNAWSALAPCPRSGGLFRIGRRRAKRSGYVSNTAQDRLLEHQFGAGAHRAGRAADRRAAARHPVPAGNQGARQHLSRRAVRPARLYPSAAQRPADASWRRDPQPRAAEGSRQARLAGQWRGAPYRRRGSNAESGSRMSTCPRAATSPTATVNPKFGQKLDFIERMTRWSEASREPTIIVGDFNVAPLECDVWNHKALLTVVSHTPVEVEALTRLQQAHGWVDIGRTVRSRAGALLHLVELPIARLDPERPRPPARPYVGIARACRPSRGRTRCSSRAANGSGHRTMCR